MSAGDEAHYRFPPAAAYGLNRCLYLVKSDDAYRGRFAADPRAAATELGLGDAAVAALLAGDRDALVGLGAHPYLVFMADLRLRMARGAGSMEYF